LIQILRRVQVYCSLALIISACCSVLQHAVTNVVKIVDAMLEAMCHDQAQHAMIHVSARREQANVMS
jgi:hypothetical protein